MWHQSMSLHPPPANASQRSALSSLRRLLGSSLRISIQDGRIFIGTFVCTDKARNLVIANTEEFRPKERKGTSPGEAEQQEGGSADSETGSDSEDGDEDMQRDEDDESEDSDEGDQQIYDQKGRYVGMVMIPWKYILEVEEDQMTSIARFII